MVSQFQPPQEENDLTVDQQVQSFEEQVGLRYNMSDTALKAWRDSMTARGLDPDATAEKVQEDSKAAHLNWWEQEDFEYKPVKG